MKLTCIICKWNFICEDYNKRYRRKHTCEEFELDIVKNDIHTDILIELRKKEFSKEWWLYCDEHEV